MTKEMLTTKEVAEYLSINEKQVYRLIKERKIPATRITGKWLFPKQLVDEWVMTSARENVGARLRHSPPDNQVVVAGSNDLALELLAKEVNLRFPMYNVSLSNLGSLGGVVALQHGSCHIAASHLLDERTGDYNVPIMKTSYPDLDVKILNLCYREQGLIVRSGNPLGIQNLRDLADRKAVVVNRQEGSGSRVLFDYKLKQDGIDPAALQIHAKVAYTHMEVALDVLSGSADAGIGILAAAKMLGLGFIPLAKERFDLILRAEHASIEVVKALRQVLASEKFKLDIAQMAGYDARDTGMILYESATQ